MDGNLKRHPIIQEGMGIFNLFLATFDFFYCFNKYTKLKNVDTKGREQNISPFQVTKSSEAVHRGKIYVECTLIKLGM